eukprot:COSAG01_NODE_7988_length_2963_cov_1.445880_1_plen_750_part_10
MPLTCDFIAEAPTTQPLTTLQLTLADGSQLTLRADTEDDAKNWLRLLKELFTPNPTADGENDDDDFPGLVGATESDVGGVEEGVPPDPGHEPEQPQLPLEPVVTPKTASQHDHSGAVDGAEGGAVTTAASPRLPADIKARKIQWMWADAGIWNRAAKKNPARWHPRGGGLDRAIAQLQSKAQQQANKRERPVELRGLGEDGGHGKAFDSAAAAAEWLIAQLPQGPPIPELEADTSDDDEPPVDDDEPSIVSELEPEPTELEPEPELEGAAQPSGLGPGAQEREPEQADCGGAAATDCADDDDSAPLRILCVDGGGIKGLIPALILQELELQCGGIPVRELFDLVVGTSTGGIIALGSCVANREVKDMVDVYENHAAEIWKPRGGLGTKMFKAIAGKKVAMFLEPVQYDRSGLETILKVNSQYQDGTGRQMHLGEFYNEQPKVAVVANRAAGQGAERFVPFLFRTYTPRKNRNDGTSECEVWEAACATSAAPGYYEPMEIDGVLYVDGGVTNNNPVEVALKEANSIWPGREVACILSLGCGQKVQQAGGGGTEQTASKNLKDALNQLTDTEQPHDNMLRDFEIANPIPADAQAGRRAAGSAPYGGWAKNPDDKKRFGRTLYVRLNPPMPQTVSVKMDTRDPDDLALLRRVAESFIKDCEARFWLENVAKLVHPREMARVAAEYRRETAKSMAIQREASIAHGRKKSMARELAAVKKRQQSVQLTEAQRQAQQQKVMDMELALREAALHAEK